MFTPNFGWGHQLASVFGFVIWVLLCLLAFSVVVALVFLLVRFLLVGTRAAQLYVDRHEPPRARPATEPPAPSEGDGAPARPQGAHAVNPNADTQAGTSTQPDPADPATSTEPTSMTESNSATRPLPSATAETEQLPTPPRPRTSRAQPKSPASKPPTTRSPRTPRTPPGNPAE